MSRGTRPTRPLPSLAASLTLVVPGGSAPWGRGRRRPTQSGQEAPEAPGAATLFALPNSVAKENKPGNLTARAVRSDQGLCVWWRLPALAQLRGTLGCVPSPLDHGLSPSFRRGRWRPRCRSVGAGGSCVSLLCPLLNQRPTGEAELGGRCCLLAARGGDRIWGRRESCGVPARSRLCGQQGSFCAIWVGDGCGLGDSSRCQRLSIPGTF